MESERARAFEDAEITSSQVNYPSLKLLRTGWRHNETRQRTEDVPEISFPILSTPRPTSSNKEFGRKEGTKRKLKVRFSSVTFLGDTDESAEESTSSRCRIGRKIPHVVVQGPGVLSNAISLPPLPSPPWAQVTSASRQRRRSPSKQNIIRGSRTNKDRRENRHAGRSLSTRRASQDNIICVSSFGHTLRKYNRRRSSADNASCLPPIRVSSALQTFHMALRNLLH